MTHARIGIKNDDGTITSIYCHSDGYVEFVGNKLYKNYTTKEQVMELIRGGNISTLGENYSKCSVYMRDWKGETWDINAPYISKDMDSYIKDFKFYSWFYFFDNGKWYVFTYCKDYEFADKIWYEMNETFMNHIDVIV